METDTGDMTEVRENILNTVSDLCANFLYYDRKEDEELSADDLIQAVENGVITIEEIVQQFEEKLRESLEQYVGKTL